MALISKPMYTLTNLRRGMGSFWDNVSAEEIDALYNLCSPNADRVLASLTLPEDNPTEALLSRWLVRFINSSSQKLVRRFVQFATGCSCLVPGKTIRVEIVDGFEAVPRPTASTCFSIFRLPRQYRSFAHLSENLEFYLTNTQFWDLSG